ncbi:hypothetical protein C8A01DRAFT_21392, partial [Parachaetomium inaequale]
MAPPRPRLRDKIPLLGRIRGGSQTQSTASETSSQASLPGTPPVADEGSQPSNTPGPGETSPPPRSTPPDPTPAPSLTAPPSEERVGLFEFPAAEPYRPALPNARHVDIIAVHGLDGHWRNTWTGEDGAIWLRDRLPDLLRQSDVVARIRSFGYDAATVFSRSVGDLPTAGKSLLMRLRGFRKTPQEREAPIIFVCHSLGGLVVKEALVHAWNHSLQHQDILDKVKGCLFLGVPHRGSGLADWGKVAPDVAKWVSLGFAGNSNFVRVLKESSKDWVRLSEAFVERADSLSIRSFYETEKYGNVIVVDQSSAAMHIRNEVLFPLEGSNHRSICKFRANEHQRFSPVGDAVVELAILALPSVEELKRQALEARCLELLPIATNTFVGRKRELKAMGEALDPRKPGQKGMVLYGLPGVGKSQLALRYIDTHRELFTSIFWITASSPESTSSSFSEAARLISSSWPGKDVPNPYAGQDDQKMVLSRLRCTRHTSWLLVIDSADDLQGQDFTQCVPACPYGSFLVTSTRREATVVFGKESQEIGSLDPESGQLLLTARLRKGNDTASTSSESRSSCDCYEHITAIVKELDHLPLPIEYAAALVQLNRFTLENFVAGYQQRYQRVSAQSIPRGLLHYEKSRSLFTLVEMLYSAIQEESPEAAALLTLLAFLGPWRFDLATFQLSDLEKRLPGVTLVSFGNDHLLAVLTDNFSLDLAVSHLRNTCLVKPVSNATSPDAVSVHNIICQWVFETTAEKELWILAAAATVSASVRLSQERILFPNLTGQSGRRFQLHLASLNRCANLAQKHISPADLAVPDGRHACFHAHLRSGLAFANLFASRLKPAKTDFEQAVEYLQLRQGDAWPSGEAALYLLYGLAVSYHREGDTEKTTDTLKGVLALAVSILGEDDPRTVEIRARAKTVDSRTGLNLRHQKAALLASTAGDKPRPGPQ